MKSTLLAFAVMFGATAAHAQGIEGIFQTQRNDDGNVGMVQFYQCGSQYCGRLIKSFDQSGAEISTPHTGRNIVAGMTDDGNGSFSGGTIWDPGADRTYRSKMTLSGQTLNVSGCVAIICRTQRWTRVQ